MRRAALVLFALFVPFPLFVICAAGAENHKIRAAVFDFELIDTSLQGEMEGANAAEHARLARLAPALREKLAASDIYEPVDMAAVEAKAKRENMQTCGGCDAKLASEAGADVAITGTVQKVSNLILNINIFVRDAKNDAPIKAMSVDIRGNTDESWMHGLDFLAKNRLLAASDEHK
jgi:hypothetical protein